MKCPLPTSQLVLPASAASVRATAVLILVIAHEEHHDLPILLVLLHRGELELGGPRAHRRSRCPFPRAQQQATRVGAHVVRQRAPDVRPQRPLATKEKKR